MTTPRHIPGWSIHAQQVAWFQAWLRAVRSGDARLAALAAAELGVLGVGVSVAPQPAVTGTDPDHSPRP
jgi:hypothetical protein